MGSNWVRPHWLERQPEQQSAAVPHNISARNWTVLANLGSSCRSRVDERGLVAPWRYGWSLDWWIGADDRWHFPSWEAAVRQRLVDATPVVETAMRLPGGDAVHRAYALRAGGASELVVIEIENRSPVPFAVAFAIRPYNLEGMAPIECIHHEDRSVTVDGRIALLLPSPPRFTAGSTGAKGDVVATVQAGSAACEPLGWLHDEARMAQAAFLYPLAHTATVRVAIPVDHSRPSRLRIRGSADVARSWQAQTRRGMQLDLPPGGLAEAVEANRRFLVMFQEDVVALDRYGFHDEAAEVLGRQPIDDGAAVWRLAEHWRLTGDIDLVRAMVPKVAVAAQGIERRRQRKRRRCVPAERGLLDSSYAVNFWALGGLNASAVLLAAAGEEHAGATAARWADGFKRDLDASLAVVADHLGPDALVACTPLHLYPATDPAITESVDAITRLCRIGGAIFPTFPERVLRLAAVQLEAGDRQALEWLARLLDVASPTWTWSGGAGDGHDAVVGAMFSSFVRDLLVREIPGGLALCTMLPHDWPGQSIEVHHAPTQAGLLSFAVRWHGLRPALLWELRRHRPAESITLTAPGLDPQWQTDKPAGEALLGPLAPPAACPDAADRLR